MTIRVIVVDDHPLFRDGVIHSLNKHATIEVVADTDSGEKAYALIEDLIPDLVLMDITMDGADGIESTRQIVRDFPVVKVMMLTVSEHQDDLMRALKAGARGYVLKGIGATDLIRAVETVAGGDVFITPQLANSILFEMTTHDPDPINTLNERESQILQLVGEGLTNREIGERLHLAEKTIKHYMSNVLEKLQVRSRVEAALLAQRRKLDLD